MKISKKYLKKIIQEEYKRILKETHLPEPHRCMDGTMVGADSSECHMDIVARIEDAEHHRNSHSCGTENRIYYK